MAQSSFLFHTGPAPANNNSKCQYFVVNSTTYTYAIVQSKTVVCMNKITKKALKYKSKEKTGE